MRSSSLKNGTAIFVGKLVLILDTIHWNPETPPQTLSCVCLRCDGSLSLQINEEGRSQLILPKNLKRSAMSGYNNDHSDLLLYLLVRQDPVGHEHRKLLLFANPSIPLVGMDVRRGILSLFVGLVHACAQMSTSRNNREL
ncbi:hypothetical protein V6N13_103249 [Hibiscus sabdariffa]